MVRRLVLAILGVTVVALAVSWVGLLVLSGGAARDRSVDELTDQAIVASEVLSTDVDAPETAEQLQILIDLLDLDDATLIEVDPGTLEVAGRLPDVLSLDDLDRAALADGSGRSGTRGNTVFVALPTPPTEPSPAASSSGSSSGAAVPVLVVTRLADPPPGVLNGWLLLTSVVALAVGTAVALGIAGRMSRPVVEAGDAAERIASGERGVRLAEPAAGRATDELGRLARALNEMAATIEQADDLERQFLVSVSHDLRTPLTSIRGYAEAIADRSISDLDWATSVIRREADRLDRLIRDLLDLARLDARSFSIESVRVDVVEAVRLSVEMLLFRATDADMTLRAGALDPAVVDADPDRLMQITGNLIDNALKFAVSEVIVSVEVTNLDTDGARWVRIHVDDDGAGIAEHERSAVFERHFTTASVQHRGEQGTGLGLALVAQLAAAFHGEAFASSAPAGGARLTVSLPLADEQPTDPAIKAATGRRVGGLVAQGGVDS
jgi:signal transduction histidine kinase